MVKIFIFYACLDVLTFVHEIPEIYHKFLLLFLLCFFLFIYFSAFYLGRCHKTCNTQFGIVCGSDGRTYWNECALNNAICQDKTGKLKKVTNGPCKGL